MNLEKAVFISTGVAIACLVDVARLSVYSISLSRISNNYPILLTAIFSAFLGAYLGNKLFKKTSIDFLKWFVGVFMFVISFMIILGIINK